MKRLFKGAKIIDGTGAKPLLSGELLIEGDKVVAVYGQNGADMEKHKDAEIIELKDKVIIPGLINGHLHILEDAESEQPPFVTENESDTLKAFRGYKNVRVMLRSGVTYGRDLGGPGHINIEVKKAIQLGLIDGAEFVTAGKAITTTGGHIWKVSRQCDGVSEVRKAVREQVAAGADCIKMLVSGGYSTRGVHPKTLQFMPDEVKAAVEIAHYANKKIAAHAYGLQAIKIAVDAGVDCVEHCEFFPDDDTDAVARVIEKMAKQGTYCVPTISAWFKDFPEEYGKQGPIKIESLQKMLLRQPDHVRPMNIKREYYCLQYIFDNMKLLYKAGVPLVMGTDAGVRDIYFDRHPFEMKCLQFVGMTPMEVILSATKVASELLGISNDYGTLENGKLADFVILNKDPLLDMDNLNDVDQVYKKGQLYAE